ncbi:hypothetical protein [Francisella frigiditurris]|uniref:Uncharacterized protein n=1 Tax=Francisella frigiditurris TaxID=1542390 RepID=A0A1J0KT63_9GAMM|nr:hypothetical protein [Francisella frigiditurris]APC96945.1 hypothetical protein KX01_918 [Francisella frigiditurris]
MSGYSTFRISFYSNICKAKVPEIIRKDLSYILSISRLSLCEKKSLIGSLKINFGFISDISNYADLISLDDDNIYGLKRNNERKNNQKQLIKYLSDSQKILKELVPTGT